MVVKEAVTAEQQDTKAGAGVSACCAAEKQVTCCEPSAKSSCCGTTQVDVTAKAGACGCQ